MNKEKRLNKNINKSIQLYHGITYIHEDIIEEAECPVTDIKTVDFRRYLKWTIAAACAGLVLLVSITALQRFYQNGFWSEKPGQPLMAEQPLDLPLLAIRDLGAEGMGFEGYMAFDASELTNANPWRADAELATLPVYKNTLSYDEYFMPTGGDFNRMEKLLKDVAGRLGLDTENMTITNDVPDGATQERIRLKYAAGGTELPEGYFVPRELRCETQGLSISVDQSLTVQVDWEPGIPLPAEYDFDYYASRESVAKVAEYLRQEYKDFIGMENPVADINGGDYTIYREQFFDLSFYDGSGSYEEQIVNYNFNRVSFAASSDNELWLARIYQPDLSQKMGDYPLITVAEAKELLLEGNYITSVPYEIDDKKDVVKVELVYRTGRMEEYFLPYYRFLVEIPQLREEDGLKNYGAYYVPAVAPEYIGEITVRESGFYQ